MLIEVSSLSKFFGDIKAVDHVSFSVDRGEILGFLGPNGAGKSTTMKMITGFLAPSGGTAQVGGYDIVKEPQKVKELIGYLPETSASYPDMTVSDFLHFIAEIRGFNNYQASHRVDEVIEKCFLEKVRHQTIDTLSKGYRQRVGFAQAILHDPSVLILDEPTDGLDPNQKQEVRNLIKEMGKDKCIILSTHILEEVDAVCSRAIIIANGKIVVDGSPDKIREESKSRNVVELSVHQVSRDQVFTALKGIENVETVDCLSEEKDPVQKFRLLPKKRQNVLPAVSDLVKRQQWTLDSLHQEKGRLDEVFRDLTMGGEA